MTEERVVVTGHAVRDVAPDRAEWRLEVQERGTDPSAVFATCAERQAALLARLRELEGIENLSTGSIDLGEDYRHERGRQRGYEGSAAVRVALDPSRSAELLSVVADAGVDEVRGPRLSSDAAAGVALELLEEAVADARARAERLATAAQRALGRVVAVEERPLSRYDDDDDDVIAVAASGKMSGGASFEIAARPLQVAVRVRVVFAFADADAPVPG